MTAAEDEALLHRRKRLYYQCSHRGTREMDLVLGRFAARCLTDLSAEELSQLELLLPVADAVLLRWFTGTETVPDEYDWPLTARIRDFAERELAKSGPLDV